MPPIFPTVNAWAIDPIPMTIVQKITGVTISLMSATKALAIGSRVAAYVGAIIPKIAPSTTATSTEV